MPVYTYRCTACQREIEIKRPISEYDNQPEEACICTAYDWERLIGPTSFILQGGGWFGSGGY